MDQKGHLENISSRRLQSHIWVQHMQEFYHLQHERHNLIDRFKETVKIETAAMTRNQLHIMK
jgi:hypothetical protein